MDKRIEQFDNKPEDKNETLSTGFSGLNSSVNPSSEDLDPDTNINKKIFIFISFIGLVILGFLFWYNNYRLENSLARDVPDWILAQLSTDTKSEEEKLLELKDKDTDQDGLSDYAELYQYGTSIFLADTDSDGYSDHEEVLQGYDALCPEGQDCNLLRFITPQTKLADVIQDVNNSDISIQDAVLSEFRALLLDNGFSQEELDLMSDDDLLEILATLADLEADNINNSSSTPEQIRQFLLSQSGADEDVINSLSDEELMLLQAKLGVN